MSWLVTRLREPSTYAGLAILLAAFHLPHADAWTTVLTDCGIYVGGLLAIILAERKPK